MASATGADGGKANQDGASKSRPKNLKKFRDQADFSVSRVAYRRAYSRDPKTEIPIESPVREDTDLQWTRLHSWFLGPKGENEDVFRRLACQAIERHCRARKNYFITDKEMVTKEIKEDESFKKSVEKIERELEVMSRMLEQSVPSFSPRYQGHMLWDTAMPANLGYIQALLYNQNNVAVEASPVTTDMEITVCKQLCDMIFETCKSKEDKKMTAWGRITSGGSIANIEALWASRNVKFIPLAVKELLKQSRFSAAEKYNVFVPRMDEKTRLTKLKSWDLLNLNIDDIVKMPKEVSDLLPSEELKEDFINSLQRYSVTELGIHGIMETFKLKKSPVILSPSTNHYSWPKAVNILGLGIRNLLPVGVTKEARMCMDDLKKILKDCLKEEISVISVVVVIGTTEESAVDPLENVLKLREKMRKKGLNFAINADAAWGGYFMTMLGTSEILSSNKDMDQYVPYCDISGHTFDQLRCLHMADTVTVDPHKSGFIPYSAGAICYRNGEMKNFIKMEATVVAHEGEGDKAIGICSIQGSRPGAAAAGILMAHKIIGLNADGYGRILGQCMYGAKLFYWRWMTLARDDDPFILVLMKGIPDRIKLEDAKSILKFPFESNLRNSELIEISELRQMIRRLGPDMLINAFSVNVKGNKDVELCNSLNKLVYRMLSHSNPQKSVSRVPLILTQSEVDPKVSKRVVESMKDRLGLPPGSQDNLHFLINTVMNPFIGRPQLVEMLGDIFRQTVLAAIGTLTDVPSLFKFVTLGKIKTTQETYFFAEFIPSFTSRSHQYQAVVKFKLEQTVSEDKELEHLQNKNPDKQIIFETVKKSTLGDALEFMTTLEVNFQVPNQPEKVKRRITVRDVPLFRHFDLSKIAGYPNEMKYFLYGQENNIYMTHVVSRGPDFNQVLKLAEIPDSMPQELLHQGIEVLVSGIPGNPTTQDCNTKALERPKIETTQAIQFTGENGSLCSSTITVEKEQYFMQI